MDRYDITIQMLGVEASGPQYVWEKVPAEEGELVLYTDAQATIAALQAQLNEQSEKLKYHDLFKKWQCWRDPDELVDEYEKWQAAIQEHQSLKDQLTQRTAELEAARRERDEWIVKWDEHDHYPKGYVTAQIQRVVKRAKRLELHGLRDTDTNEFLEGYEAACNDILAAIQKGRA